MRFRPSKGRIAAAKYVQRWISQKESTAKQSEGWRNDIRRYRIEELRAAEVAQLFAGGRAGGVIA